MLHIRSHRESLGPTLAVAISMAGIIAAAGALQNFPAATLPHDNTKWRLPQDAGMQPLGCIGRDGQSVDWWLVLKHPQGYGYSYLSADRCSMGDASIATTGQRVTGSGAGDAACGWEHGLSLQQDGGGPPSRTLAPLAGPGAGGGKLAHAFWNDDDPGGTEHWDAAHSKGAAAFDAAGSGFWLQHSVPRWPDAPGHPGFDTIQHPQTVFGQHLACFSFGGADGRPALASVARLLATAGPHIHSSALPPHMAAAFPEWAALLPNASEARGPVGPASGGAADRGNATEPIMERFMTAGGLQLVAFAKPPLVVKSLPDDIVGPALMGAAAPALPSPPRSPAGRQPSQPRPQLDGAAGAAAAAAPHGTALSGQPPAPPPPAQPCGRSMFWETWRRSADETPSQCPQEAPSAPLAVNVASVRFPGPSGPTWGWGQDHSKWGVSEDSGGSGAGGRGAAVCLCDLNRAAGQMRRGGACVCAPGRVDVWRAFRGIVESVEPCRRSE